MWGTDVDVVGEESGHFSELEELEIMLLLLTTETKCASDAFINRYSDNTLSWLIKKY